MSALSVRRKTARIALMLKTNLEKNEKQRFVSATKKHTKRP